MFTWTKGFFALAGFAAIIGFNGGGAAAWIASVILLLGGIVYWEMNNPDEEVEGEGEIDS